MVRFQQRVLVGLIFFTTILTSSIQAQTDDSRRRGFLLDRLSIKQLKTWLTINKLIHSEDLNGQLLHPTLKALFDRLQNSYHTIYLEFDDSSEGCPYIAGMFDIERLDPEGESHIAVIKLRLRIIERASVPPRSVVKTGFIPFVGLDKLERYTEVLGHEMAHAVDVLFDPARAATLDDFSRNADIILEEQLRRRKGFSDPEAEREIQRRDDFLNELEKPAESAEAEVWRELYVSKSKRRS